jgi:hypothetical protein
MKKLLFVIFVVLLSSFVSAQEPQTLALQIKINDKIINEEDLVSLTPEEKIQLKVFVSSSSGHPKDITNSEKTIYQAASFWNLAVHPDGLVEVINYPFDFAENHFAFFGLVSISYKDETGTASRKVRFYIETVPGHITLTARTHEAAKSYFSNFNLFNHDRLKKQIETNPLPKAITSASNPLAVLSDEAQGLLKARNNALKNENNVKIPEGAAFKPLSPDPSPEDLIRKLKEIPGLDIDNTLQPTLENPIYPPAPASSNVDKEGPAVNDLENDNSSQDDGIEPAGENEDNPDFIDYEKLLHQPPSNSETPLQN